MRKKEWCSHRWLTQDCEPCLQSSLLIMDLMGVLHNVFRMRSSPLHMYTALYIEGKAPLDRVQGVMILGNLRYLNFVNALNKTRDKYLLRNRR